MKFCPVVPEICRGQVHGPRKEKRKRRRRRIIIIRNGAKTISLSDPWYLSHPNSSQRSSTVYYIDVHEILRFQSKIKKVFHLSFRQ